MSNVLQVFYAATKYDLPGLKKQCADFFRGECVTRDNCMVLWERLQLYEPLVKEIQLYIKRNADAVLSNDTLHMLPRDKFEAILRLVDVQRRPTVFERCCKWGRAELARKNQPITADSLFTLLNLCGMLIVLME